MRALVIISFLLAVAMCGCDPIATARVRLQLRSAQQEDVRVTVDSSDTREALGIVDSVVTQHGFHRTHDYLDQDGHGFIRRYSLSVAPNRPLIACHLKPTATGIEVEFGEFGVWRSSAEAKSAACDLRTALATRYGGKYVR